MQSIDDGKNISASRPFRLETRLVVQDDLEIPDYVCEIDVSNLVVGPPESLNSSLCYPCQTIAETIHVSRIWMLHGDRYCLAESAKTCALCQTLWEGLEPNPERRSRVERGEELDRQQEIPRQRLWKSLRKKRMDSGKENPRRKVIVSYRSVDKPTDKALLRSCNFPWKRSGNGSCRIFTYAG